MAEKEILCAYGIDIDAVAGWLGSYGGEDSPDDISRGMFAGEVGTPRLLNLFEKYDMRATWFIPGHSIETFPDECRAVVEAGHEIGSHGYSHENPVAMTPQQERDVLEKCIGLIEALSGRAPGRGRFRGPSEGARCGALCLSYLRRAVDWAGFGIWISMLLHARGGSVLRVKGLLDVGEDGPVVLDGVGGTAHPPPRRLARY